MILVIYVPYIPKIANEEPEDVNDVFTLYRNLHDLNDSNPANWLKIYQFNTTPKRIDDFEERLAWSQTPQCARVYNRSFCIKHDDDVTHGNTVLKMLFVYNLTKIYFRESVETKREERVLDETSLEEVIKSEMNVNIEKGFVPRNIPL